MLHSSRIISASLFRTVITQAKAGQFSGASKNFNLASRTLQYCKTMKIGSAEFKSIFTPELNSLADIFKRHGYEIRIAGGAVRDLLTGKTPQDLDFATTATPHEMHTIFEKEGIRMINNRGEKHGTVTCRINDKANFEVTTLRIDVVTDGRHAEVKFTEDWKLDAERRDLTINSLFLGLDGTLYDYFNGVDDLNNKRVRFVGNAESRIQEDYLRILRYFRFFGRISDLPNSHDEVTLRAIKENASGLNRISGERVWVEMKKIAAGRHVDSLLQVMFELGVLSCIGFPKEVNVDELQRVWRTSGDLNLHPMTILSSLLYTEDELNKLNARVKMSKDEFQLILFILSHRSDDISPPIAFDYCQDIFCDSSAPVNRTRERLVELLKYLNLRDPIDSVVNYVPPKFPVDGIRLLEIGVPKGPKFARVLAELRELWKKSRYTMTEDELIATVKIEHVLKT